MKILLAITHGALGGAQKRVYDLARKYEEAGMDVTIGMGKGGPLEEKLIEEESEYHQFLHLERSHRIGTLLRFIFEMRRCIKKKRLNVLHLNSANTLPGAVGAKLVRKKHRPKTVFTFNGLSLLDPGARTRWYARPFYKLYFRFFLRFVDEAVFECKRNFSDAKRMNLVESGTVIYPGMDFGELHYLSRENARFQLEKKLSVSLTGKFVVGSVGRLSPEKNYQFLIRNFSEVLEYKPEAILLLIGDGPERKKLETLVEKQNLSDKVFFLGEHTNAHELLCAFDMFVLPSYYEGVSVALTEALIAGLPLLVSDAGGNAEVIYGKRSAAFKTNNSADFIRKFKDILSEEGVEREETETLEQHVNKFLLERSSQKYLELYQSLR